MHAFYVPFQVLKWATTGYLFHVRTADLDGVPRKKLCPLLTTAHPRERSIKQQLTGKNDL
jgi:hypothetical protein